ncbi:hypothetical protein MKX03_007560 [Papaver bracteatum]|nr:hypothetical protein MKX03_007560 [Papaver bracteatum]
MEVHTSGVALMDHTFGKLPDHLLIEISNISCVKQRWANLFRGECLWKCALLKTWPLPNHVVVFAFYVCTLIWLAVIDNLDESEKTFLLLIGILLRREMVFEKLFTDFGDCFDGMDYYDILACAKLRFQPIPSPWLGY